MADQLFSLCGLAAMIGWAALALSLFVPSVRAAANILAGFVIPAIIAVAYIALLARGWGANPDGGFGSIAEVRALFSDDYALAAGWVHYLAFDLFVGAWIVRAGLAAGVKPLLLLPPLPLTFLFGPAGLLAALVVFVVSGKAPWRRP